MAPQRYFESLIEQVYRMFLDITTRLHHSIRLSMVDQFSSLVHCFDHC